MTTTPEPKDKLDTMSEMAFAAAMAALGVNGPEDEGLDWAAVDWRATEENVRRLRQRISFTKACLSRMHGNVHVRF